MVDIEDKATLLRQTAFPKPLEANLIDIPGYTYPTAIYTPQTLEDQEIRRACLRSKPLKAPGPDGIPNFLVHLLIRTRPKPLHKLFQACWDIGYHPVHFRKAETIFLRKPGKDDYSNPANYRPIALLNTLGKALEAIVTNRLKDAAESYNLLPNTQYGARPGRSTDTALYNLIESTRLIKSYKLIPSVLTLDVQKAFDNVSYRRLIHNLQKKGVPIPIVRWIQSFLSLRSTSIRLGDYTTTQSDIEIGIPQGSPISPILYLFYNADLLEDLYDIKLFTYPIGFVDDINILTYSDKVEENNERLQRAYQKCLNWADKHGSRFNPQKSELIHLSRTKIAKDRAELALEGAIIKPKKTIRILKVYLNRDLTAIL